MSTTAHLHVVGIAQDGGHPQIGCFRHCCAPAWADPSLAHLVACVALVDPDSGARWLLDASPDIGKQLALLGPPREGRPALDGVLVTHAHLGHVVGLLQLGREALAGDAIPVWAMPDLRRLVETQIPFSLLIRDDHISLQPLGQGVDLGPFRVDPIDAAASPHAVMLRYPRTPRCCGIRERRDVPDGRPRVFSSQSPLGTPATRESPTGSESKRWSRSTTSSARSRALRGSARRRRRRRT